MSGGSTSVPDMSLALSMLAAVIDRALLDTRGGQVPWALVLHVDHVPQYVSNCSRDDGLALVADLLANWSTRESST